MKTNLKRMMTAVLAALFLYPAESWGKEGVVQCGNLIYAGTQTSRCFSDEFLSTVQQKTRISTSRRFRAVRLDNEELFRFPFVVMTGEGDFVLTARERETLKKYVQSGGFLLASAGCSNAAWDASFRREMRTIFGEAVLKPVSMRHPVFSTVFNIKQLEAGKQAAKGHLEGVTLNDKLVIIYSADGLNDSRHSKGCCCCGGSELGNALEINANILAYALLR